ncbi:phospholipase D family protein [Afifella sp. H1R]|uniref:phospholipase D family protein n=1 Tax=Afifella sp. H1R TaxID=2908841 RepID=UPI001F4142A8|nr:phospholipase D family protein [Afifella sp. H1R]MCF1504027.1 phospholipase D family protein [Afifella sp. H1R]
MGEFLHGTALDEAIRNILRQDGCCCAVAFWGRGASKMLPARSAGNCRIICNLSSGGTNPYEIEKLAHFDIRQVDILHAKVYLAKDRAVVGSANVSANGLGFEADEQARWIEAAVLVKNIAAIKEWFDRLWKNADEIRPEDLEKAKKAWKQRRRSRPSLPSFRDFDPSQENPPQLWWVVDVAPEYNPSSIHRQLGRYGVGEKELIREGLDVSHSNDKGMMSPGTHFLVWVRRTHSDGLPDKRYHPYWFCAGRRLKRVWRFDREADWADAVLPAAPPQTPPFDLSEPHVVGAIMDTLAAPEFALLREDDDDQWFTSQRITATQEFWRKCKDRHQELCGAQTQNPGLRTFLS